MTSPRALLAALSDLEPRKCQTNRMTTNRPSKLMPCAMRDRVLLLRRTTDWVLSEDGASFKPGLGSSGTGSETFSLIEYSPLVLAQGITVRGSLPTAIPLSPVI